MPLKPHQRELISGKYIGQSIDFKKIPRADEWDNLVKTALKGLSTFASPGKPRSMEQGSERPVPKAAASSSGAPKALDDSELNKFASKNFDIAPLGPVAPGPNLTDPNLVGGAINRYNAASLIHASNDRFDKSVMGSLLVDIYALTGGFMHRTLRDDKRTDRDCQLFAVYRGVHFAAAEELAQLFGIPVDRVDIALEHQMIRMTEHGAHVDAVAKKGNYLVYLKDEDVLAHLIHIDKGKFYYMDKLSKTLIPFDTTKPEWTSAGGNSCHLGCEANFDKKKGEKTKGVSGFCMTLNRNLYAFRHSLKAVPGGAFYHSSYTGGSDVLCTGCLTVENGVLTYLNNFSGHYRPAPHQLQLVVDHLRTMGVPLLNVKVQLRDPDDPLGGPVMSATSFLNDKEIRKGQFEFNVRGRVTPPLTEERAKQSQWAKRIRKAVADYLERAEKWYSKPSEKSRETAQRLRGVIDENDLIAEVRFCIGQSSSSPFNTPVEKRISDGQLKSKLIEALKD